MFLEGFGWQARRSVGGRLSAIAWRRRTSLVFLGRLRLAGQRKRWRRLSGKKRQGDGGKAKNYYVSNIHYGGIPSDEVPLNPQLHYLIELQKFDLRIFEIQDHRQKIPELIKTAQAPSLELTHRLNMAKRCE